MLREHKTMEIGLSTTPIASKKRIDRNLITETRQFPTEEALDDVIRVA
jgi:hypothetical protein